MEKQILLYDATLRDGAQAEGISFSLTDKRNILLTLDSFGIDYVEGGFPASNPKDQKFFADLRREGIHLQHTKLTAFGSTPHPGISPREDSGLAQLLEAETPAVTIFGKASLGRVEQILGITPEDNLTLIRETIEFLAAQHREVIFDAEHFFDGFNEDPDYARAVLFAAADAGAQTVCLCDTSGGSLPFEIGEKTEAAVSALRRSGRGDVSVAIHCHNDGGCAVANSMMAVHSGVSMVQGTMLGFGERCGNADLATVAANLILKCGAACRIDLRQLSGVSHRIAEISNVGIMSDKPYIGSSAFAHKGGTHIAAVQKNPSSFEHVDPAWVGNERRFLLSEAAGRSSVLPRLRALIPALAKDSPETRRVLELLKARELEGYQYEGADASLELLIKRTLGLWQSHFRVILYKLFGDFPTPEGADPCSAVVKVEVDQRREMAGAEGNGPVNALDSALRRALRVFYPSIESMYITDYKVRVIDGSSTSDARIRVLIDSTDGKEVFTTVGVSTDVIEASFTALTDSFEYLLSRQ